MQSFPLKIKDQQFHLHPSGALYWEERKALLVADVHLGKVTHFRKHGSAVPLKALQQNFEKLEGAIQYFNPTELLFLGDLFHSFENTEWDWFVHWKLQHRRDMVLISGNHDIIDTHKYESVGVSVVETMEISGFLLSHHPTLSESLFNFSGHIHPGVSLHGLGRQRVKTACFFWSGNQFILPAFGVFTGKYVMQPKKGDRVFAVTPSEVIEVSGFFTS